MNKKLFERWKDQEFDLVKPSPFGLTKSGYHDFRCAPLLPRADALISSPSSKRDAHLVEAIGVEFHKYDFSDASLNHLRIESCRFSDCNFHHSCMTDLRDWGNNLFEECNFERADLRIAHLGIPPARSIFKRCIFNGAKTSGIIIGHIGFEDIIFHGEDWVDVDFNVSAFLKCSFRGLVSGVTFRGGYLFPDDQKQFGRPNITGLHNVSFKHATLSAVGLTNGCTLDQITLPEDGSSFICKTQDLLALEKESSFGISDKERTNLEKYLSVMRVHADDQAEQFISLDDIIYFFGKDYGKEVYRLMKSSLWVRNPETHT